MALLNLLLLLLLLGLGVPGKSISLQKRIIGGHNCGDDERHYHVKIRGQSTTHISLCGGSLISDQWVLTAAHCWKSDPGWVVVALFQVHPKSAPNPETYQITRHEIYKDSSGLEHDIMLLKLDKKITTVQPIQLANCPTNLPVGTKLQIAGLGPAITGPNMKRIPHTPTDLQCADIKIVDTLRTGTINKYTYQYMSCASSKKDTSEGDSGGGWVYQDRLYGVHVFTGDADYACSRPAGFMDVCSYQPWIDNTIKPLTPLSAG